MRGSASLRIQELSSGEKMPDSLVEGVDDLGLLLPGIRMKVHGSPFSTMKKMKASDLII
jgi:hypothetical protein